MNNLIKKNIILMTVISILACVAYLISIRYPVIDVLLRNSEDLSAIFKACGSIKPGDSLNIVHKKMDKFVFSNRSKEGGQLVFYTPKHSADLCRVYINKKGQVVEKIIFDLD